MYVTHRYLGVEKGNLNYLFILMTEDYIEESKIIQDAIRPLIEGFARALSNKGAVIVPFKGNADDNLTEMLKQCKWLDDGSRYKWLRYNLPAILIISENVIDFNPDLHPYIIISLRQSINEFGQVKAFEIKELFDLLLIHSVDENMFENAPPELLSLEQREGWQLIEMKPGIWGFSIDLIGCIKWLKQRRFQSHQYV